MGLTRPKLYQFDTGVSRINDPITVLHQGATTANVDVGFLFNRANGLLSNVALYWSESGNTFALSFTNNSGAQDSNITVTSYANVRVGNVVSSGFFFANGTPFSSSSYSNTDVAEYLPSDSTITSIQANVTAANLAITTANTGMKSYVDAVTTAWTSNATTQAISINTIDANLGTATTNITTLFSNAATQATSINTINANLGTATTNITTLFSNAATQATSINTINANLGTATTNITTLFSNAATQATSINTINANLGTATTNITTLFSNAATQATSINTINANLGTATTNINTLFSNAATQQGQINTLQTQVYTNSNVSAYLTSGGPGNVSIVNGNITLPLTGPGATNVGSATSIPTIVTDNYGRIVGLTSNAVSTTITLAGGTGTGSVAGGGTLTIGGTSNQIATSVSGSTFTVGLAGNITTPGDLTVTGNLTIQGNTLTIGSNNLTVTDSIIDLHTFANLAALVSDDGRDIGIRFHYYKNADRHAFLGWENGTQALTYYQSATETNGTVTGTLGNVEFGSLYISNSSSSTSTTTGALVVAGGIGVVGAINSGLSVNAPNLYASTGLSTANAVITGGSITGITGSATTFTATNFSSGNAVITGGSFAGHHSGNAALTYTTTTNFSTANAVITGGSVTGITGSASTFTATNFSSGNAVITGGSVTGHTGSATTFTATNFSTANAVITGGSLNGAAIGATSASTGAFTTLTATTSITRNSRNVVTNYTGNTSPTTPLAGDEWFRANTSVLYKYIYDGTNYQWIDLSSVLYNANTQAVANTIALRDSGANLTASNFIGISSTAKYADLAEIYLADTHYEPGTVVVFGGSEEVTVTTVTHDTRVAGVVSTNPAYLMNSEAVGLPIALTGRVPCFVQGPINKGDVLVTSPTPGVAQKIDVGMYRPGSIIGKALKEINNNEITLIEVVVGRF